MTVHHRSVGMYNSWRGLQNECIRKRWKPQAIVELSTEAEWWLVKVVLVFDFSVNFKVTNQRDNVRLCEKWKYGAGDLSRVLATQSSIASADPANGWIPEKEAGGSAKSLPVLRVVEKGSLWHFTVMDGMRSGLTMVWVREAQRQSGRQKCRKKISFRVTLKGLLLRGNVSFGKWLGHCLNELASRN